MNPFRWLVNNISSMRRRMSPYQFDQRRNIEKECGHPEGTVIPELYQELYSRGAVPARVVQVLPRETWQVHPEVYEEESPEMITPFEQAWRDLGRSLHAGEESWHQEEEGSPVWEYLLRADILSGIGRYGVIFLGLDDGLDPALPAWPLESGIDDQQVFPVLPAYEPPMPAPGDLFQIHTTGTVPQPQPPDLTPPPAVPTPDQAAVLPTLPSRKLLYLRTFPEHLAQITAYESDPKSPRFGQPLTYLLTFNDPRDASVSGVGMTTATMTVHWSRIIHIADNLESSEVFGVPRQEQVLNNLLDLKKLYGGSAEMYWRGAFPGFAFKSQPQLGGDVDVDEDSLKEQMELYGEGLQRYLSTVGLDIDQLAPQVVDPSPQILVQLQAICIKIGVPMRVFMGTERGELASSQDDAAWNDRLRERQKNYVTPRIIIPLVNRLIKLGVLPKPTGFKVCWADLTSQTPKEKTAVTFQMTQALAQYVSTGAYDLMQPLDYLTRVVKLKEEEALVVMRNAGIVPGVPFKPGAKKKGQVSGMQPPPGSGVGSPPLPPVSDPSQDPSQDPSVIPDPGYAWSEEGLVAALASDPSLGGRMRTALATHKAA